MSNYHSCTTNSVSMSEFNLHGHHLFDVLFVERMRLAANDILRTIHALTVHSMQTFVLLFYIKKRVESLK